uniref:Uncharacterized protein n=1 Tax=Caenorhabditis japonica TaxID=281687 RepID=A0A8R1DH50_CAEJA
MPEEMKKDLEKDFQTDQKLESTDPIFEHVTAEQFTERIVQEILKSGKSISEIFASLIKLKEYIKTRSDRLHEVLNAKVKADFETIRITLPRPFDEQKWTDLETMENEDLNKKVVLFNDIPTNLRECIPAFGSLQRTFDLDVRSSDFFSCNSDSYGLPPVNCRKILNPLLWARQEIEREIRKHNPNFQLEKIVTGLNFAPKEGHLEKMSITSFFLELTADNLDYTNSEDRMEFFDNLQLKFGTLKVDELTMVLPDILVAYSEELAERSMQVSYFIPYELFRMIFVCWRPEVVKLRLRTEACSSIEDAARIEWDDEEVFTSTTLYNSELFDRCEPVCLGLEKEFVDCKLIVEASASWLFDAEHNEKNVETAGRDFLALFPMNTIFLSRTIPLRNSGSMKCQIKKQIEFTINTFFFHSDEHHGRVLNYQMMFSNCGNVQLAMLKKCIPHVANGKKIGVNFDVEEETKELFSRYGGSQGQEKRSLYASCFDAQNQFILDLKFVLVP